MAIVPDDGHGHELTPDEERALFAEVFAHQAEGAKRCPTCHGLQPCQPQLDARFKLRKAGVDLDRAIGTIWS